MSLENIYHTRDIISYRQIKSWEVAEGILVIEVPTETSYKCIGFLSRGDSISKAVAPLEFELRCLTPVRLLEYDFCEVSVHQVHDMLGFTLCTTGASVEEKFLNLLRYLAYKTGKVTDSGVELGCRIPQELFASCIGTTRVTITRCLKSLEKQGRIKRDKVLTLLDIPNLLAA